jgi:hypothetical protein
VKTNTPESLNNLLTGKKCEGLNFPELVSVSELEGSGGAGRGLVSAKPDEPLNIRLAWDTFDGEKLPESAQIADFGRCSDTERKSEGGNRFDAWNTSLSLTESVATN